MTCGTAWALCGHEAPPGTAVSERIDAELGLVSQRNSSQPQSTIGKQEYGRKLSSRHACRAEASEQQASRSSPPCEEGNGVCGSGAFAPEGSGQNCCNELQNASTSQMGTFGLHSSEHIHRSLLQQNPNLGIESYLPDEAALAAREEQPADHLSGMQVDGFASSQRKHMSHVGATIPMERRVVIGMKCKRLIDHARLQYLLGAGLQVNALRSGTSSCLW